TPRPAKSALRQSYIKLTVRSTPTRGCSTCGAVERLPVFGSRPADARPECSHDCSETGGPEGQFLALPDTMGAEMNRSGEAKGEL
ncbi:MAG: hypothetical protein K2V38_17925, partial [Gemmataceae bacterium]|nr:hypothetical protein [Gemmataceae bacterium]